MRASASTGALSTTKGVNGKSSKSKLVPLKREALIATGQTSVLDAADQLIESIQRNMARMDAYQTLERQAQPRPQSHSVSFAIPTAEEEKEENQLASGSTSPSITSQPTTSSVTSSNSPAPRLRSALSNRSHGSPSATAHAAALSNPRIRARGESALRKLWSDLDARVAVPLYTLPPAVNIGTILNEQAYAGKIPRIRGVVELQPSSFKAMHSLVQQKFKTPLESENEESISSSTSKADPSTSLKSNPPTSTTATSASPSTPNSVNKSESSPQLRPTSSSYSPPQRPSSDSRNTSPIRTLHSHVLPDQPPSTIPYNRYGSQRPAIVDQYRTFHKTLQELPPMKNPNPSRETAWKVSSVNSSELNPALMEKKKSATLHHSPSEPIILARDKPPEHHTPRGIDFSYTPHERALRNALHRLPVPLESIQPTMFAYEYAPPIEHRPANQVMQADGRLTTAAQGYSANERVSLLVDDFRHEYAQTQANQEWLHSFRAKHAEEKRAQKSKQAKEIWRQAMEQSNQQEKAGPLSPMEETMTRLVGRRRPKITIDPMAQNSARNMPFLSVPGGSSSLGSSLFPSAQGSPDASAAPSRKNSVLNASPSTDPLLSIPMGGMSGSPSLSALPSAQPSRRPSFANPLIRPGDITPSMATTSPARSTSTSRRESRSAGGKRPPPIQTQGSPLNNGIINPDTPSPTTPEGFYFAPKFTINLYNKKKMETSLGLQPDAHDYDSEIEEWLHGEDDDEDEKAATADDDDEKNVAEIDHDTKMDRMLKEVIEKHKALHTKAIMYSAILPKRSNKTLNAARFVMSNPSRKKSKLKPGESYAKGNGHMSAVQEWEHEERKRKEREERVLEQLRQQNQLSRKQSAKKNEVMDFLNGVTAKFNKRGGQEAQDPDAPIQYKNIEPNWLKSREDYRHDFLPRSQESMCLNSMEKPLAIRSKMEIENVKKWLKTLPYLKEFHTNPSLQQELVALCHLQTLKAGELLYKKGDVIQNFYILLAGELKVIQFNEDMDGPATRRNHARTVSTLSQVLTQNHEITMITESSNNSVPNTRKSMEFDQDLIRACLSPLPPSLPETPRTESAATTSTDRPIHNRRESLHVDTVGTDATFHSLAALQKGQHLLHSAANSPTEDNEEEEEKVETVEDYGASLPNAIVSYLQPRQVFGQSKEQQLLKEHEAFVAQQLEEFLTPAQRAWKRIRDRVRPKKQLMASFQAADDLEQLAEDGGVSKPVTKKDEKKNKKSTAIEKAINPIGLAGRVRTETVVATKDDTLVITISQADHDRIVQLAYERSHRQQVVTLRRMKLFQHGLNQKWKMKHFVHLLDGAERRLYQRDACILEEDTLGHELYFIISGSVALHKDVEMVTQTRIPSQMNEWTIVEQKRFKRIPFATRHAGDSFAEEVVLGCTKADFTYKVASSKCEVFVIHRAQFLPFYRAARLADLKEVVTETRSQVVNYLNQVMPDYLPGNAHESLGALAHQHSQTFLHGEEVMNQVAASEPQKKHVMHVNMLETLVTDLRGEERQPKKNRGRRGGPRLARMVSPTKSAASAAASENNASSPHVHFNSNGNKPLHSPTSSKVASPSSAPLSPAFNFSTSSSTATNPTTPALTGVFASPVLAVGQPEHRPHSPTKFNTSMRLPCVLLQSDSNPLTPALAKGKKSMHESKASTSATTLTSAMLMNGLQIQEKEVEKLQTTLTTGTAPVPVAGVVGPASSDEVTFDANGSNILTRTIRGSKSDAAPPAVHVFFSLFAI